MEKSRFYLVQLPVISITVFFCCCLLAAFLFPGSQKEGIGYASEYYSFTHIFLSELGSLKTNTDETNPAIIQQDNRVNWRPGGEFVRPKWGIYRSLIYANDLRDERVRFADFQIIE